MASFEQLTEAVEKALKKSGVSKHLKAQLFSAVAAILDEGDDAPEPPKENVMINSLIHEYLEFNGMVGTSRMLALESGLASEQRLAREFMAYNLGLDGELAAQTQADIPLLYGAVAQVSAARQAAISAGLASHSAQPPALMHPTAAHEAQQLGDAIARAYKTDALRDLHARSSADGRRAGDAARRPPASHSNHPGAPPNDSDTGSAPHAPSTDWLHEHTVEGGIGVQGRVGQPVRGGSAQADGGQAQANEGSAAASEGSYDDDFTDDSGS